MIDRTKKSISVNHICHIHLGYALIRSQEWNDALTDTFSNVKTLDSIEFEPLLGFRLSKRPRPRYFIIDEIEEMSKRDQASLLNLMESGLLSELKHRQQRMT
jgi:hypothetical protein